MLDKLIEDLIFAMNFDDKVPEHILEEIFRHNKNKNMNVEHELETLTVDEFNEEVDKKLGIHKQTEEEFFDTIVGYSDVKKLLMKCIQSMKPIHVILDGAPASAKSMFLLQMQKKLENVYYVDCTNATGSGMVNLLFENDVKYLLLDEVEKMNRSDQNVLLNVIETGILTSTKVKKTATKKMNLSIYATTNDIDAISKPFRSRFIELSLPEYNFNEFSEIAIRLTEQKDGHDTETAMKIADTVWNKLNSRDVRDIIQISKLTKSMGDVEFVANILQKYKKKNDQESKSYPNNSL